MKAAVFYGPNDLRVEEVSDPKLQPDGIIVKVKTCGVCGTDLHAYKGKRPAAAGSIMGHEFSADVIEVGANVKGIKKGDRVTGGAGAFAEYVGIPLAIVNKTVFPFSDKLSYEEGACAEPLSVGLAVAKSAEPKPEDTVVILGAGMIGYASLQVFKAMGVSNIIVSEISKQRLEAAKAGGADILISAKEEDPFQRVYELTSGRGADIVAECAGAQVTFRQAIEMARWGGNAVRRSGEIPIIHIDDIFNSFKVRKLNLDDKEIVRTGGRVCMAASYEDTIPWDLSCQVTLLHKNVSLIGCLTGDIRGAVELLETGKVNLKPIFTHEFSLDNITEAFNMAMSSDSVKVMVAP
ncbi:MAG: zinc-binding dehydrogenase [Dehalococcoidales bacterium]|nr:zinc-binding dehydrogenase [Dehalococcoidales bacterium]